MVIMVRMPWSSKSKKKEEGKGPAIAKRRNKPPFVLPRGRLWEEPGRLEKGHEERQRLWEKATAAANETPLDSIARKKMANIDRGGSEPFFDLQKRTLTYDMFERPWGTEVLVYVWWARWDDIGVHVVEKGFVVEVDLGQSRDVMVTPKGSYRLGGKHYFRHRQDDITDLPNPKLQLEDHILHILFEGATIPSGGHSRSWGSDVGRSGKELLAYLKERDRRKDLPRDADGGMPSTAPKL